jgi:hypothetical protein
MIMKNFIKTKRQAEVRIKKLFWKFHNMLVNEYPDQRPFFDNIVWEAYSSNVLWEVLNVADEHLAKIEKNKGPENVEKKDFVDALLHGYSERVK